MRVVTADDEARWTGAFDDVIVNGALGIWTARIGEAGTLAALVDASLVGWTLAVFPAADDARANHGGISCESGGTSAYGVVVDTLTLGLFATGVEGRLTDGYTVPIDAAVGAEALVVAPAGANWKRQDAITGMVFEVISQIFQTNNN